MSNTKNYYDSKYAETFLDAEEKANDFDKLRSLFVESNSPMEILDIGCGAGVVSAELVTRGHHVLGIDLIDEAVRRACARGLDARVHDLSEPLPFDDETFDAVFAPDILEHLFDPVKTLLEMHRVLKRGGHAYVVLPNHFDVKQRLRTLSKGSILHYEHLHYDKKLKPEYYFHIRFFNWDEVLKFIRESSFVLEATDHIPVKGFFFHRRNFFIQNPRIVRRLCDLRPSLFAAEFRLRLKKSP